MKRPSFQFYPGDWSGNSNLRRCSHAERGIWIDVLCLMHDQCEYGVLRWSLQEIARAVGCSVAALRSIVSKGVLKGSDNWLDEPFVYVPRSGRRDGPPVTLLPVQAGPVWYSSRMVRDEYVRTVRGDSSRFSEANGAAPTGAPHRPPMAAPNDAPNDAPKPPFSDGSSSSSSSSSSDTSLRSVSGVLQRAREPVREPEPDPPCDAVTLAIEARRHGIETHPHDPRLMALADQAVGVKILGAACEAATRQYPGERIGIGLVAAILTRWAKQAERVSAAGAVAPRNARQSELERRNAEVAARWVPPELREVTDAT